MIRTVGQDAAGYDTTCPRCGSPCGLPCTDCGYLVRDRTPSPYVVTPWPEYGPLTAAEKLNREDQEHERIVRETLHHYNRTGSAA